MPGFFGIKMKIDVVSLRISREYQTEIETDIEYIYGIEEAASIFNKMIGDSDVEKVGVLCLDGTFKIINFAMVSIGRVDTVRVPIAQIVKTAIMSNASKIIVGHNHPSGVLEITSKDKDMTQKIGGIAKWLDIDLLDSIVVNENEAISIRKEIEGKENV